MLVAALCACGRIAFDTTANGDGGGGSGDTGGAGDGSGGSGDASGDGGAPANWTVFSPSPSTASDLFAVASFAGNNVWIGGAAGITYQFDGTTWTPRTGPTVDVRRFWGQSATDLWAVGVNCVVQRWDGNAWNGSTVTGCVSGAFFGIGGVAATDLWVGGAGGRLNHLV
ncbi:MAG TPA: hypothetical protein VFV99_05510, partial [Kofleriaceae bacterium]|nr:hypothetical protein [Kofleriaceae bacterium]